MFASEEASFNPESSYLRGNLKFLLININLNAVTFISHFSPPPHSLLCFIIIFTENVRNQYISDKQSNM